MNCDKEGCPMLGRIVYCLELPSEKYHYTKCPFYGGIESNEVVENRPMSENLLKKLREGL